MSEINELMKLTRTISESDDDFTAEIDVDLSIINHDDDVDFPNKLPVTYEIDIDYRSWGIKSMHVYFKEPLVIEYKKEFDSKYSELKLDLNKDVEIEYVAGGSFTPVSIEIYLDIEGVPVYKPTLTIQYVRMS